MFGPLDPLPSLRRNGFAQAGAWGEGENGHALCPLRVLLFTPAQADR
jgi:hypothetical protein